MSVHTKEPSQMTEILLNGAKGSAFAVIIAAVLLFALSAVAYSMEDPDSLTAPFGYAALYLSAAVAGGVASRLSGDFGGTAVLCAAASGVIMLFILVLMSFLPTESSGDTSPIITVLMYAAVPAVSSVAGLALRHKRVRKIKHKKRR